jgi:hypothetical protein
MMIKKRNKLSIVTAFIVGTTMLSPMDKAWGMDDGNDLKPTSSSRAVASRFFLTGTTRVSEDVRKAAENLSDVLEKNPNISKLNARGKNLRKGLVKENTPSLKNISTLAQGGILRVMADLDSEKPGLPLNTLFSESLKAIQSAVEDPCDVITSGESKLVVGIDTIKSLRDDIIRAKGDGKLSDFFSDELPNLVTSYPAIVNSLIARFPREEEKIEQQRRKLEMYFYGDSQKKAQRELSDHQKKIQEQRRIARIDTLAEAFYLLKQINDRPTVAPLSAPVQSDPSSSSSSSSSYSSSSSSSSSSSGSMSLSDAGGAIPTRIPGKIAIYGDDAPLSVLSFPGDYKLADTLREKRLGGRPLSVPDADEIKGDGFNYYCTVSREEMARLNNATLLFQVEMKSNAPAYIEYWDGLKEILSLPHTGSDQWETLTVEFTVNSETGRWFNFYPAILPAVEGIENPSTQIRNCTLHYKK